jgi:hypothetical protein
MSEYERNGTANLFIVCEPLIGWRHISITKHRTKLEYWAHCIKEMVDLHYPEAEKKIVLVMDNLNIHTPAALYARRSIRPKPDASWRGWRSTTPQRARLSWLNMAEIELSDSSRCCWLASVWSSVSPTGRRSPGK